MEYIINLTYLYFIFMSSKLTFGYWGIRGRGQVTRLVCAYTGV